MASRRLSGDDRSAFFFAGWFTPSEFANFNVQNLFLPDGGVLEMLGHYFGIWWGDRLARCFDELRDGTRDWLETIAAAYFFTADVALGVRLAFWVEALDVQVKEAVLGFTDDRFRVIRAPDENDPANAPLRDAIATAMRLRGRRHIAPAAKEAWRAALDPSDEAFLSAFRALECVRRLYGEGETEKELKAAWKAMQDDLGGELATYGLLREAAKAARHGARPTRRSDDHPINHAREKRDEVLGFATALVKESMARETPDAS